ncbi:MAG TPA: sigma-70 family RNA polymerase sigma factor [Thermoanaerobaculia bacterium]
MPTADEIFRDNLELIEKVVQFVCRRYHLRPQEAEDFRSAVFVKLLEDDHAVIRKFQGKSSLKSYLQVVVIRLLQDHRNQQWGRWRPCAEAERQGPLAERLDELTGRDGHTFDEACQVLWTNCRVTATRDELWAIWELLPPRSQRQVKGEEALTSLPASDPLPDELLLAAERGQRRRAVFAALQRAIAALPAEDRLILELHVRGIKIVTIARQLGLEQMPLYRRLDGIKKALRQHLESEGFDRDAIEDLLP